MPKFKHFFSRHKLFLINAYNAHGTASYSLNFGIKGVMTTKNTVFEKGRARFYKVPKKTT